VVEPKKNEHGDIFRDLFKAVEPIRFKEPFAETLGAFKQIDAVVDYTFIDVVKLAGHVCPATAGAYLCCQKALKQLYPDEIPVRGDITVTIHGQPHEGVYGVISQIFSFLTGAAPDTGFKGLGPRFRRKDLLKFSPKKSDSKALCFEFGRLDNEKTVSVEFSPNKVPFAQEKANRLDKLMGKVLGEVAAEDELKEFQDLWIEKVRDMLFERKAIDEWIRIRS
jgi:hypothetical protein